jgi:hypothetical protein
VITTSSSGRLATGSEIRDLRRVVKQLPDEKLQQSSNVSSCMLLGSDLILAAEFIQAGGNIMF